MFITHNPYWFNWENIRMIEQVKSATYMGPWSIKNSSGNWTDEPVDVFYVENPRIDLGHSHYFGMFYKRELDYSQGPLMITNGISAFSEDIIGKKSLNSDEVIVSRYRHDYIERDGIMVDGGRDYFRASVTGKSIKVTVDGSEFKFEEI